MAYQLEWFFLVSKSTNLNSRQLNFYFHPLKFQLIKLGAKTNLPKCRRITWNLIEQNQGGAKYY